VGAVDSLLRQSEWQNYEGLNSYVTWSEELEKHFNEPVSGRSARASILKIAALLHDIAKPQTKTMDEGRARFLGHNTEGAVIATAILERLRFSAREIKSVEMMVRYHMRPGQMSEYEIPTPRALYRYFRDTGDVAIDILFLNMADHMATRGPAESMRRRIALVRAKNSNTMNLESSAIMK
jgi:poly(A) polymerase